MSEKDKNLGARISEEIDEFQRFMTEIEDSIQKWKKNINAATLTPEPIENAETINPQQEQQQPAHAVKNIWK